MIDNICMFLTKKIRKEMPEIDDEKAEIINYGLQNIIGEIPKGFIILGIAYLLGILKLTLLALIIILPYKMFSGGFHLKTHIGCIVITSLFYCGIVLLSKYIELTITLKIIVTIIAWFWGIWMISLYAPADTENSPILRKKERKFKKIMSYITLSITLIIAIFVQDNIISNIMLFGCIAQTFTITRFAYHLTKNRYGHEVYNAST